MIGYARQHAKRFVALAMVAVLYVSARLPDISDDQRRELARGFRFHSQTLPEVAGVEQRMVRPVHPSLRGISAWISSVGAAVALGDLDGDKLPNDVSYVDTRTDQVVIAPVPGTGQRYPPFALHADRQLFDRSTMAPMGCIPGDLNEDGLSDVLVYYWGRTPLAFLRRQRDDDDDACLGPGSYVAQPIVAGRQRWFTNAATRADVDGDGHVDLIIGNYFQDGARILDPTADGTESMQHSMSRAFNGGRNRLLLWAEACGGDRPNVRFRETPGVLDVEGRPVSTAWTLAVGAADLDGDLLPEIYFANDFGPDRLLHNRSRPGQPRFELLRGERTLTTPASKVLGRDSFKGMGVDFGDLNGDGHLDIYVSNIAAEYALEESHFAYLSTGQLGQMQRGKAPYRDASETLGLARSGWGWETRLADFNNDGVLEAIQATGFVRGDDNRWPELHEIAMGNDQLLHAPAAWHRFQPGDDLSGFDANPFFVRAADGRFYDVAPRLGLDAVHVSRGMATADVDADGDLDFAVANQWEASQFFRNDCPQPGAYLALRLMLPVGDHAPDHTRVFSDMSHIGPQLKLRPAIGAAAIVEGPNGDSLVGQVDGGNGHSGVRSPDLHFGLGAVAADSRFRVTVRSRDRKGAPCREVLVLSPGRHTVVLSDNHQSSENE